MILLRPVPTQFRITQVFGVNVDLYPKTNGHNGIDYGLPEGSPIMAAHDGQITRADLDAETLLNPKWGYGLHVRIQGEGMLSIYGHLSSVEVKPGDTVRMGQVIGRSGNTGRSTGPHLHFEVRTGALLVYAINPAPYIRDTLPDITREGSMKELGIDVSHWRPRLEPAKLEGHVTWIATKAVEVDDRLYNGWNSNMSVDQFVDDTFSRHVQTAKDIGAKCMAFIFGNTIYKSEYYASAYADHTRHPNDRDPEILALRQALEHKEYHAFSIDVERWWRRYNPYLAMLRGEISGDLVEKVPSLWIRNSIEDLYVRVQEEMQIGNFRTVPINFYLGRWFVIGYCPELDTFLQDKLQWLVEYRTPVHRAAILTSRTKLGTWEGLEAIIAANTFKTDHIGNKACEALQLTDKYFLPGVTDDDAAHTPLSVDVDVLTSDWSVLFTGAPVIVPPVVEPPPVVIPPVTVKKYYAQVRSTAVGLKLRTGPSTTAPILDYDFRPLPRFEIEGAPVVSGAITWASLGRAFFAVKQNDTVYADVLSEETK